MDRDELIESFRDVAEKNKKELSEELRKNLRKERNYTPTSELIENNLYVFLKRSIAIHPKLFNMNNK